MSPQKIQCKEKKVYITGNQQWNSEAEDQGNDLDDKKAENTQWEQEKYKKNPKFEDNIRSLWENFKCTNIHIIGVLEEEHREQEIENLVEK